MKAKLKFLTIPGFLLGTILQLYAQGYIVPNGVITNYVNGFPGEISVVHDPTNSYYTGFALHPSGKTQPTVFTNTFSYDFVLDVGVRVFLVASNQPISLESIVANSYTELMYPTTYVFDSGFPFYVGLYTGNQNSHPRDGIYTDPLFGWARLVNNQGIIQLLDSALAYQAQGIFAGTRSFVPEPSSFALAVFGTLLLGCRPWRKFSRC